MSFSCATAICSTALESVSSGLAEPNRSVMTLRPVSAAKVSGVMNFSAARSEDYLDAQPALHEGPGQFGGFIGGDSTAHAQHSVHGGSYYSFWRQFLGWWHFRQCRCISPARGGPLPWRSQ